MATGTYLHHLGDDGVFWSADGDGGLLPAPSVDATASSVAAPVVAAPVVAAMAADLVAPMADLAPVLYLTEPGTATPVSVSDINQGQLGDCFLLAPLGEEALVHPASITSMIRDNGNGSETVTLYTDQNGRPPGLGSTVFTPAAVMITNSFSAASVNNGPAQDAFAGLKEIWPQVVEKAVATLDGGYAAIANGGYPTLAMAELTGHAATAISPAALSFASLQQFVAAGDLITMDTSAAKLLPDGLISGHCYMFKQLSGSGTSASVQLLNPWGLDQPPAIPLTQLAGVGIVEIDIGHAA